MVMRPDGKLYIVPAEGGEARLMKCNTPLMNSWHTFSPNGRWMAFSSKSRSPYTQLYLTHVDSNGNDTPPILVDNTTAANRAVNLPEFANIPKGGLEKIDPVANQYYKLETSAIELMTRKQFSEAIPVWRNALEKDPSEGRAHLNLAYALIQTGQPREALAEYRKACDLSPEDPLAFAESALAMAQAGAPEEAISYYRKSLALDASNAGVQADLGALLSEKGAAAEGIEHLEKAVALKPESAAVRYKLASALLTAGQTGEAIAHFSKAVELAPDSIEFRVGFADALSRAGRLSDAIAQLQKSIDISGGQDGELVRNLRARLASYEQAQRR
jgi:tetratricopeptide (TPR) repeat protein